MNNPKKSFFSVLGIQALGIVGCASFLVGATTVQGQLTMPLTVRAALPIMNEYGQVIEGDGDIPQVDRPLVQVLSYGSGIVPPNELTGAPHAQNAWVHDTRIGIGINPTVKNPGTFATSFSENRPANSAQIFVRVYNASTLEASLFYGDSQVLVVDGDEELFAYINQVTNVISWTRDSDGDSIADYWEHLNFGGATNAVADAMAANEVNTVLETFIAGLDPRDSASTFMITSVERVYDPDDYVDYEWEDEYGQTLTTRVYGVTANVLSWPSVGKRLYRVEFTTNLVGEQMYTLVPGASDVPATPPQNYFTNTYLLDETAPIYYRARVRLAPVD